ncbi:PREDICTED: elongation factor Tu GTP-binding domain-containing protein 1 [Fragaria vesca subsp. vesca]|uniref:elongation factor Tu GTP-binding domain-containing protein 1 n=1 Tax=Fragaria vesca subsp. vesca TaxID=101020 RepID=UPI0002C33977|nr:PREDICTED: elongation factor Tu GTP-binding domain-containing protein 1 [Fragaria vesca subsp. vesca]
MADPTQEPDTRKLRNICILAHVDHGKTTLCDHLISGSDSGIIHPKLAGRLRYMDSLLEEQRRAITMKSSSIALRHRGHSVTVIDSPGHMDFCSEVSTAARLSDGALILVDAVEGVHIQTHAVLRQAWIEKLTPCLVINKIDRLISELEMSPREAYIRLLRIVHEVNNIVSAFKSVKYLNDVDAILSGPAGADDVAFEEIEDDEELMFQPQKGNVAFVCALDGWGFTISQFAEIYREKFGWSVNALQKALWGPWYFNHKEKKIVGQKGVAGLKKARPMFVEFVLEPVWSVYQAALKEREEAEVVVNKVIKTFKLTIPPRDLKGDAKGMVQAVMSHWLPLHEAILSMVIRCMPDPIAAQSYRISRLLPKREGVGDMVDSSVLAEAEKVRRSVEACDSRPEAPCVAFVSKMFAVSTKMLPKYGLDGEVLDNTSDEGELDECFLAFARIYSGVLRPGEKIYVLSALYDPSKGESMQKHIQVATLQSLYLMMGQNLQHVPEAQAGDIVAIRGLGQQILKTATLSSTKNCWPFSSMSFQVSPTLKVAIEPSDPADMGALMKGLRLLNRADPFVEVTVSARGEHVLSAAGEVHLERCIKDLKDRFARVGLEVSKPLVSFKETILGDESTLENLKSFLASSEYVEKATQNGRCVVRVKVLKLPPSLTKVIDESSHILADILGVKVETSKSLDTQVASTEEGMDPIETLRKRMMEAVESDILSSGETDKDRAEKCKVQWQKLLKRIWALGPWHIGPNILLTPEIKGKGTDSSVLIRGSFHVSEKLGFVDASENENAAAETSSEVTEALYAEAERLQSSVLSGFQLATAAGPLCDEPMWGLAFVVEAYISPLPAQSDDSETSHQQPEQYGIFTGQVMTAVKDACRAAVLQKQPRLVEAMYFCELITPTEQLGNMYAVLGRRRTKVLKEEMQEGSPLFTVHAYVPVAESFGFADELRRWTAGAASALLVLSHWEALDKDPFFVPKTDEEKEEFGDGSSVPPNTARKLINAVRRQKGLPVEEKVVQHATKQRTLARKV